MAGCSPRAGQRRRNHRSTDTSKGGGSSTVHPDLARAGCGEPPRTLRRGRRRQAFARPLVGPPQYSPWFECSRLDSYVSIKTSSQLTAPSQSFKFHTHDARAAGLSFGATCCKQGPKTSLLALGGAAYATVGLLELRDSAQLRRTRSFKAGRKASHSGA